MKQRVLPALVCSLAATIGDQLPAQQPRTEPASVKKTVPQLKLRTLGGTQFWTDELVLFDWRIQRNALYGKYRLLDDKNRSQASGTFDLCRHELERLKREKDLPPLAGRVVLVLHGLGRTRNAMTPMCRFLKAKGGYVPLNITYASTRESMEAHAQSLARVIEHLGPQVTEINFVAHSMGNLVIRHYLRDQTDPNHDRRPDPRIRRIVMLGPPNRGTQFGGRVQDLKLFQLVLGPAAVQMATHWHAFEKRLATPECQFGIIAGGRGQTSGRNPLLDGDDDLVVSVEETRLAGAHDFVVLPVVHTVMMRDPTVLECTHRFLEEGHFFAAESRKPIPADL